MNSPHRTKGTSPPLKDEEEVAVTDRDHAKNGALPVSALSRTKGTNVLPLRADYLRANRHRRGWSQAFLADRAGISRSYLAELEAGYKSGSRVVVTVLAKALGMDPSQLLHLGDESPCLRSDIGV